MPENVHECDLFLLTSHNAWNAEMSLESFARIGRRNINGWGIGFYRDGISRVVRSEIPAAEEGTPSREFMAAIKAVSSDVILGHLRKTTRGANIVENNHPFKLNFLGYDWLMIHNGTGYEIQNMIPPTNNCLFAALMTVPEPLNTCAKRLYNTAAQTIRKASSSELKTHSQNYCKMILKVCTI